MAEKKKQSTSYDVIRRWRDKNYKQITIQLRYDTDADILSFLEEHKKEYGVTPLFRDAMKQMIENWNK